jgi:hypothetical protein
MDGFSDLRGGIEDVTVLIQALVGLLAVVWVVRRYAEDKSIVKLMTSLLLAGIFVWSVHNVGWLLERAKAEATVEQAPPGGDTGEF